MSPPDHDDGSNALQAREQRLCASARVACCRLQGGAFAVFYTLAGLPLGRRAGGSGRLRRQVPARAM